MRRSASTKRAEDDPYTGDRTSSRHIPQSRLEKHAKHYCPRILCIWLESLQTRVLGGVSTRDVLLRHIPATPLWTDEPEIYQRGCRHDDLHRSQGNLFTTMTLDNAQEWLCTTEALTLTASTSIVLLRVYFRKVRLRRWKWSDWMNGMYCERRRVRGSLEDRDTVSGSLQRVD